MRWLIGIAVVAFAGFTAAAVYEPQVKRFFSDCHEHGSPVEVGDQSFTLFYGRQQLRDAC